MTSVVWFRRDLRLRDHPALRAAAATGPVLGLFVLDPVLWRSAGPARQAWLAASLRALDESMGGRLCIRMGTPSSMVPALVREVGAAQVHVTNEFTPYARARDRAVVEALPASVEGIATGTPYAVAPGTVLNGSGRPYRVFTPFSRAWRQVGWEDPVPAPRGVEWVQHDSDQRVAAMLDRAIADGPPSVPRPARTPRGVAGAGPWSATSPTTTRCATSPEPTAPPGSRRTSSSACCTPARCWPTCRGTRDRGPRRGPTRSPGASSTPTCCSPTPRARGDLNPVAGLSYDDPGRRVRGLEAGRTGYPIVDAGMRQLLAEGWMHNRVRMITRQLPDQGPARRWPRGARHFLRPPRRRRPGLQQPRLAVGGRHGHRRGAVLPGLQPDHAGHQVRPAGRLRPPLGARAARTAGQARARALGRSTTATPADYPRRIVDHAEERARALARYQRGRG